MADDFVDKLHSLGFSRPRDRRPKVTEERDSHIAARTTEHWDDHVDAHIEVLRTPHISREDLRP